MAAKTNRKLFVHIDGRDVPLNVRKIKGARHIRISWQPVARAALLTLPYRVPVEEGLRFLERKKRWLASHIAEHGEQIALADGAVIPLFGEPHTVIHDPAGRGVVRREPGVLHVSGDAVFIARRVRDWLKAQAKQEITRVAELHAAALGARIRKLGVRDTASRWGSCSADGVLSFSWRLIFAPREVLEYVVVHEVAHLKELNHSDDFWRIVERLYPGHICARRWLRAHGHRLYAIG